MNILLVSQDDSEHLQVGGKHIHQNILIKEWRAAGHNVATSFPAMTDIRLPLYQRVLYRLTRRWGQYPSRYFDAYLEAIRCSLKRSIRAQLRKRMPDLVSAQDPMSAVACGEVLDEIAGSGRRPPITLTLHGYYTWEMFNYGYYGEQNRAAIEMAGFVLEHKALKYAHRVITVDSRIRNYLRDTLSHEGGVDVIFNAIDLSPFKQAPARIPGEGDFWTLLMTRRMVLKNGVIVAIEALAEVVRNNKAVRLVMVGDGPEWDNVVSRARQLGIESAITFVGAVSHGEVAKYYLSADILLMPSIPSDGIEEATSLSMLEGMAARNLVICSAIGGMKEIIRDGETGFLVEPDASDALAGKILEVMALSPGERQRIVNNAVGYVWDNHASSRHAARILSVMRSQ